MRRSILAVCFAVVGSVGVIAACVGDSPSTDNSSSGSDGGGSSSGTTSSSGASSSGTASSSGSSGDSGPTCAYAAAVLADKPVHYIRFKTATTDVVDEVNPSVQAGTFRGATTSAGVTCTDDHAAVTDAPAHAVVELTGAGYEYEGTKPFSVELWFKPTLPAGADGGSTDFARLFAREHIDADGSIDNNVGYSISYDAATRGLGFARWNGAQSSSTPDGVATTLATEPTTFTHVVATYDGSTMKLFVNGAPAGTHANATLSIPLHAGHTLLGARPAPNGDVIDGRFTGAIDEVAVYDFALADARVKAHFDAK